MVSPHLAERLDPLQWFTNMSLVKVLLHAFRFNKVLDRLRTAVWTTCEDLQNTFYRHVASFAFLPVRIRDREHEYIFSPFWLQIYKGVLQALAVPAFVGSFYLPQVSASFQLSVLFLRQLRRVYLNSLVQAINESKKNKHRAATWPRKTKACDQ